MKAVLLLRERQVLAETSFVELVVWRVPQPLPGSRHEFKYTLALISDGNCMLRYDNGSGKGDHKHVSGREVRHRFRDLQTLRMDFWTTVQTWGKRA